jgi:hypothetical protein
MPYHFSWSPRLPPPADKNKHRVDRGQEYPDDANAVRAALVNGVLLAAFPGRIDGLKNPPSSPPRYNK